MLKLIETALQREKFLGHDRAIFFEVALYGLGKVYLQLGDEAAAQRAFAHLRVYFPDSSYKAEVERLLEKL